MCKAGDQWGLLDRSVLSVDALCLFGADRPSSVLLYLVSEKPIGRDPFLSAHTTQRGGGAAAAQGARGRVPPHPPGDGRGRGGSQCVCAALAGSVWLCCKGMVVVMIIYARLPDWSTVWVDTRVARANAMLFFFFNRIGYLIYLFFADPNHTIHHLERNVYAGLLSARLRKAVSSSSAAASSGGGD